MFGAFGAGIPSVTDRCIKTKWLASLAGTELNGGDNEEQVFIGKTLFQHLEECKEAESRPAKKARHDNEEWFDPLDDRSVLNEIR